MMNIYLDNASTTKPCDAAKQAVSDAMESFGNPSSLHRMGMDAEKIIKNAREEIARRISADKGCIYFTSGGTEANNMAIFGTAAARKKRGKRIITTAIEHPSVGVPFKKLEEQGFELVVLSVDGEGRIDLAELESALNEDTILVSIMAVNNEIGTIQPIVEAAALTKKISPGAYFHTDCVQGFMKIPIQAKNFDLISMSAHKICGIKGAGALYIAPSVRISPLVCGGGQQKDMRSGTENVVGIAAFAASVKSFKNNADAVLETRNKLKEEIFARLDRVSYNGAKERFSPYILNLSFGGIRSEILLHSLESKGIYVSTGSACSSNKPSPSQTLTQIGCTPEEIDGAIRFSFSRPLSDEEISYVAENVASEVGQIRRYYRR